MRNQPLLVSIVIGIIVVFVIVGASLVAKLSNATKDYKSEFAKRMELEEENQKLKGDLTSLQRQHRELTDAKETLEGVVAGLQGEIATAKVEIEKLKKIKDVFEEKLKEELTKDEELPVEQIVEQ